MVVMGIETNTDFFVIESEIYPGLEFCLIQNSFLEI